MTASKIFFSKIGVDVITNLNQSKLVDIMMSIIINSGKYEELIELSSKYIHEFELDSNESTIIKLAGSHLEHTLLMYSPYTLALYLYLAVPITICSTYTTTSISKEQLVQTLEVQGKTRQAFSKKLGVACDRIGGLFNVTIITKSQGDNIQFLIMKSTDKDSMLQYVKESGFQSPGTVDRICLMSN